MNLLAIDSSTRSSGVAVYDGVRLRYECIWDVGNNHSVGLAPAVHTALEQAQVSMSELSALAIAIGPGSYTGLRIGLAFAKGLAFAHGLPLVAVNSLDILAAAQPLQDLPMAAVLQAGRGRLGVGWYENKKAAWVAKGEQQILTAAQLSELVQKPTYICGELSEEDRAAIGRKYKNALIASPAQSVRRPGVLAELAWQRWQAGEVADSAGLSPVYLQSTDAVPQ
jgi:tRNA threonylcarbamoyladenosine biosynthesis protein TsaB